jgi:hypothetical protein
MWRSTQRYVGNILNLEPIGVKAALSGWRYSKFGAA